MPGTIRLSHFTIHNLGQTQQRFHMQSSLQNIDLQGRNLIAPRLLLILVNFAVKSFLDMQSGKKTEREGSQGMSRAAKKRKLKAEKESIRSPMPNSEEEAAESAAEKLSDVNESESWHAFDSMDAVLKLEDVSAEEKAKLAFQHIIGPTCTISEFESQYFEVQPLLCAAARTDASTATQEKKSSSKYFKGLFSRKAFDSYVKQRMLILGKDVDITRHKHNRSTNSNNTEHLAPTACITEAGATQAGSCGWQSTVAWISENSMPEDEEEFFNAAPPTDISAANVWRHMKDGCTLRLLCPQKHNDKVWQLLSLLETYFSTSVDCNAYLVPSGSLGHHLRTDNADIYAVQIEGSSAIQAYKPKTQITVNSNSNNNGENTATPSNSDICMELPRLSNRGPIPPSSYSSIGMVEATLQPGESMYIPKGWLHNLSGCTGDSASLVLYFVANQFNSPADLIDVVLPQAVNHAIEQTLALRQALPRNISQFMGVSSSVADSDDEEDDDDEMDGEVDEAAAMKALRAKSERSALLRERQRFKNRMRVLLGRVVENCVDMLDVGVDQLMKRYMGARLPIPLTESEEARGKSGGGRIGPLSRLCVVRPNVARVVVEDGKVVVYHCIDNGRERFSSALSPLEFELDDGPAIETLLSATATASVRDGKEAADGDDSDSEGEGAAREESTEGGVVVSDLPHTSDELADKVAIAEALFSEGLLLLMDDSVGIAGKTTFGGAKIVPKKKNVAEAAAPSCNKVGKTQGGKKSMKDASTAFAAAPPADDDDDDDDSPF